MAVVLQGPRVPRQFQPGHSGIPRPGTAGPVELVDALQCFCCIASLTDHFHLRKSCSSAIRRARRRFVVHHSALRSWHGCRGFPTSGKRSCTTNSLPTRPDVTRPLPRQQRQQFADVSSAMPWPPATTLLRGSDGGRAAPRCRGAAASTMTSPPPSRCRRHGDGVLQQRLHGSAGIIARIGRS